MDRETLAEGIKALGGWTVTGLLLLAWAGSASADTEVTTRTEASPTEASPTEASPTEASPTEASPTEASPTEASPTEASEDARRSFFETLVVTATARPEMGLDLPFTVQSMDAEELTTGRWARSLPEALREVAGVMVQKTSQGQGSPYLRGFTGFRTVLLIDGIRLNNSVLREGPNQYWNTVDAHGLGELELVKGPVSVLYGSEAIGGTVQALTREPPTPVGDDAILGGSTFLRLASADDSTIGRLEVGGASSGGWRWLVGGTDKHFGDVEAGGDLGLQPKTGYRERDADLKLRHATGGANEWVAAFQRVDLDDAWRTHQTIFGQSFEGTTVGSDRRRVLDQDRSLAYLRFYHDARLGDASRGWPSRGWPSRGWPSRGWPSSFFDSLEATVSWHRQGEERDRVRRDGRRDIQGFEVDTLGLQLRLHKDTQRGHWVYGMESYRDEVDSYRLDFDASGGFRGAALQGPIGDDAAYHLDGIYVQRQGLLGKRLQLTAGARYTRARAIADVVADPLTGGAFGFDESWSQLVGSLRFSLPLGDHRARLFGGVSQAFRAPNLSDLSRFDSARSNEIETPSIDLDPETFLAFEMGFRVQTLRGSLELTTYHTVIDHLIVRTPTGRVVDGDFEVTKKNGGDGYSRGAELRATTRLGHASSLFATVSWVDGEVDTFPTSTSVQAREPLDRLMPLTGHFGWRWQRATQPWWIEGLLTVADRQDRLSSRDRGDTQRIPVGGTPGYEVFTLRAGWQISGRWNLSGGIENLTDQAYRVHGSGVNEAGRNFVLAAQMRF